jgi:hypothetical protein
MRKLRLKKESKILQAMNLEKEIEIQTKRSNRKLKLQN